MNERRSRTTAHLATLAFALLLILGLSTAAFADVYAGLVLNPSSEDSSSEAVTGTIDGGSESAVGALISDGPLAADDGGSASYSGDVDVVTTGEKGGAGVLVRSYNDHVEANVSGSVTSKDTSSSGKLDGSVGKVSAGIAALANYAGDLTLNSSADVNMTGTSNGDGQKPVPATAGVYLHVNNKQEDMYLTHCYDEDGVKVPIQIDNKDGGATPFTISSTSTWQGTEWNGVAIEDLFAVFVEDKSNLETTLDLYLIKGDGTIVGQGKEPVSNHDWLWFQGTDEDNPDPDPTHITDRTITVTLQSETDENGIEVKITQTDGNGTLLGGYDVYGRPFIVEGSETMGNGDVKPGAIIIFYLDEGGPRREVIEEIDTSNIRINSDLTGSITAQTEGDAQEAIGLYAYPLGGSSISADLHDLSVTTNAIRSAGIWANGMGNVNINGTGGVTIDVTGTGEKPAIAGIESDCTIVGKKDWNLSFTGSGNSINVQTDGPSSAENTSQLTCGIRSLNLSKDKNTNLVHFEGPVTVTDSNSEGAAYGLYGQAQFAGKTVIETIGDITVSATAGSGVYAQCSLAVPPLYVPEVSEYVRGNIVFNNAGDNAYGIRTHGGTVVVDGDINISGSGTKTRGIYAETYPYRNGVPALVYVSGTIDAPIACHLLPDLGSDTTKSSVYLWDYTQQFTNPNYENKNVDSRVGSVIKYDEALGDVTLSSDDEGFVALERDGRTYYGAYEGNAVTVSNCDPSAILEIRDARGNVLEYQDPAATHTFTVPTFDEEGEAGQLGIYLTVHKHKWSTVAFTYSDDESTVTAKRTCKIDASHTETETTDVIRVAIDPTGEEEGNTILTAHFKNEAFAAAYKARAEALAEDDIKASLQKTIDALKDALQKATDELKAAKAADEQAKAEAAKEAADLNAAAKAAEAIAKLPAVANVTDENADAVLAAAVTYNKLTDAQKKLVPASDVKKLKAAKEAIKSTLTLNVKKVTAKAVKKALKKANKKTGATATTIKTIVLGKKVKKVSKKAFAKMKKAETLVIKTTKLKQKSSAKGSLKGSKVKTIQVKVSSKKKTNRKAIKSLKKIFTKKNCGKKVTIKAAQ